MPRQSLGKGDHKKSYGLNLSHLNISTHAAILLDWFCMIAVMPNDWVATHHSILSPFSFKPIVPGPLWSWHPSMVWLKLGMTPRVSVKGWGSTGAFSFQPTGKLRPRHQLSAPTRTLMLWNLWWSGFRTMGRFACSWSLRSWKRFSVAIISEFFFSFSSSHLAPPAIYANDVAPKNANSL